MKTCPDCRRHEPDITFGRNKRTLSGKANYCKDCTALRNRAQYVKNRERRIEEARQYRAANRDVLLERERVRSKSAARQAWARQYRQSTRDRDRLTLRAWHRAHPEANAEYCRKRAAIRKGASIAVRLSSADIALRMSMFGNKCWMCSGPFECIDHVKPLSKGGPHILANLRPACTSCNSSKGGRWPWPTA